MRIILEYEEQTMLALSSDMASMDSNIQTTMEMLTRIYEMRIRMVIYAVMRMISI
jgi:hypothetical protein